MNKEVYYEGWLIKSPPTKRIWRARWRRRWFTLKQGEIPEQFCLEYYADRKCRKLKGVIDLDQCEQVDCGLRLENRKQKFQFMFDIKTPKRTYYLAADTEQDMRDWVNCICQVCHLHDTKQQPDENHSENVTTATVATNSSNDTTSTTLNTSTVSSGGGGVVASVATSSLASQISFRDVLHKPSTVIDQQPTLTVAAAVPTASVQNNNDSAYVNTEYTNRETLVCDAQFEQRHQQHQQQQQKSESAAINNKLQTLRPVASTASPSAALYLNAAAFQQQEPSRLAVNVNGVVRKIPENLVLNNTPLTVDQQSSSVQPSPALSTASGPYIPISECFSGSPKFMVESNNPTTPLNNLDPKFYDTPRSHNNIGLNLTNDQSYSPKITNCGTQQPVTMTKNRNQQRSDSDSESVFTDDDEWTHPLPLREHLDRNTRPSDSSVENESFVLTYSQRFSKLPEDLMTKEAKVAEASDDGMDHLTKVLKNKNNLILDIRTTTNEKTTRDLPQFSDTENTSPAFIGPRDAKSVVEESYDIPRSHQLPYYNMSQLMGDKILSPVNDHNPMAASTPNLRHEVEMAAVHSPGHLTSQVCVVGQADADAAVSNVRTLPRAHCYTNAAPTKVEGNVFRYDFVEQGEVPPVNRKLKPKSNIETDKSPEELPAKPSGQIIQVENFNCKMQSVPMQAASGQTDNVPLKPPSVDRKSKPNVFKVGQSNTLVRRSTGAPFAMVLANDAHAVHALETRTLPRQPRPNYAFGSVSGGGTSTTSPYTTATPALSGFTVQHQRTASANAAVQLPATTLNSCPQSVANNQNLNLNVALNQLQLQLPPKSEHKLQYFDLDVANAPPINRQSLSVSNLNIAGTNRLTLAADLTARPPVQSSVVYNSVDFVKTEAFKRIREERKKENEGVSNSGK